MHRKTYVTITLAILIPNTHWLAFLVSHGPGMCNLQAFT